MEICPATSSIVTYFRIWNDWVGIYTIDTWSNVLWGISFYNQIFQMRVWKRAKNSPSITRVSTSNGQSRKTVSHHMVKTEDWTSGIGIQYYTWWRTARQANVVGNTQRKEILVCRRAVGSVKQMNDMRIQSVGKDYGKSMVNGLQGIYCRQTGVIVIAFRWYVKICINLLIPAVLNVEGEVCQWLGMVTGRTEYAECINNYLYQGSWINIVTF